MIRPVLLYSVLTALVSMMLLSINAFPQERHHEFQVRDSATAIKIAKAAFEQEFGKAELDSLKYFEAVKDGDNWKVFGHPYKRGETPSHGGSVDFVIAVKGGCVLDIRAEM